MSSKGIIQKVRDLYELEIRLLAYLQPVFLLIIRGYWGWRFFKAGLGKLKDIPQVTGFFTELGIPFPLVNAYLASVTECVGGLCLLLGLASRVVTIPLAFTMIVAYATAHRAALLNIFSDPKTFVSEEPFLFLMTSVIVLLFGPGIFSIDGICKKLFLSKKY